MNTSVSNQHICSDISEKWENTRNDIGVVWEVEQSTGQLQQERMGNSLSF